MFLKYYGLRKQPFGVTPDPGYLYLGASHQEAYASLIYGIETGRGFMALIAPPGMGKTTLLFRLLEQIRSNARSAFLFQKQSSPREFLQNLAIDIGLECGDSYALGDLQRRLNEVLLDESRRGRRFVLVLDEAQHLDASILETVRMLSNFETPQAKLMQVILAGQPQLADKLASGELLQLHQRVSVFARLDPLSPAEVEAYIDHRLRTAGYEGQGLFTPPALQMVVEKSGGIPRVINNICFHALSLGYVKNQNPIDESTVREIIADLDSARDSAASTPSAKPAGPVAPLRKPKPKPVWGGGMREADGSRIDSVPLRGMNQTPVPSARGERRRSLDWVLVVVVLASAIWAFNESFIMGSRASLKSLGAALTSLLRQGTPSDSHSPSLETPPANSPQDTKPHAEGSKMPSQPSLAPPIPNQQPDTGSPSNGKSGPIPLNDGFNQPAGLNISPDGGKSLVKEAGGKAPGTCELPSSSRIMTGEPQKEEGLTKKGELVVGSNVSDAWILLNSETKKGWVTPHIFSLPAGTYRVSITKLGYRKYEEIINVRTGRTTQVMGRLSPEDNRGSVIVETYPSGLAVLVDGKSYGPSPTLASLYPGRHELQVFPPPGQTKYIGDFEMGPRTLLKKTISWSLESPKPRTALTGPQSPHK